MASWLEYLGDERTAAKIRERPDFKEAIREYETLRKFAESDAHLTTPQHADLMRCSCVVVWLTRKFS